MICRYCHDEIYFVPQHLGPEVLVHAKSGLRHCNPNFEATASTVAEPEEAKSA